MTFLLCNPSLVLALVSFSPLGLLGGPSERSLICSLRQYRSIFKFNIGLYFQYRSIVQQLQNAVAELWFKYELAWWGETYILDYIFYREILCQVNVCKQTHSPIYIGKQ